MFTLVAPQKAVHSDGYIVQVKDRFNVEYLEGTKSAVVETDFGQTVSLLEKTLNWGDAMQPDMNAEDRKTIIHRIEAGVKAMGSPVEIISGAEAV